MKRAIGSRALGRRQRGAIALLLALVLIGAISGLYLVTRPIREQPSSQARVLADTAAAVAGYARARRCQAGTGTVIDHLPCPNMGAPEGIAAATCPGTTVGRLPWRTLGMTPPRDDAGECLWYERSATGARVIAPGAARGGQVRPGGGAPVCGGHYGAADYLEPAGNDVAVSVNGALLALPIGC